jgi:hypothetical protein
VPFGRPPSRSIRQCCHIGGASRSRIATEPVFSVQTKVGVSEPTLRKLVERKVIRSNQRVVVISTAHGLKFAEQKIAYHLGELPGVTSNYANTPTEVAADLGKVKEAIRRFADRSKLLERNSGQ